MLAPCSAHAERALHSSAGKSPIASSRRPRRRPARRCLAVGLLTIIIGCNVLPTGVTAPASDLKVVIGGLANTNPFFGNYKFPGSSSSDTINAGTFMLASCGCGDWRVLFKPADGSKQTQFAVQFFSSGDYQSTGLITVYGQSPDSDLVVGGSVDQDSGLFSGKSQSGFTLQDIAAQRGSAHDQSVIACGLCHIGDDAIFPLPSWHPQKYKTNPTVCFECHTVNGQ